MIGKYGSVTHFKKEYVGWFMTDSIYEWKAYQHRECVARGKTKADCIKKARQNGYSVPRMAM